MKYVSAAIPKRDAMALLTGRPVYTDDMVPPGCLVVKVLRSPHAFARIRDVDTTAAAQCDGIACVLTHQDVPRNRFTMAGQSFPEPSPYDRLILDAWVRYVGDPVAIVAGTSEKEVDRALKKIRVDYEVLDPVLDPDQALDHPSIIHPESDYQENGDIGNAVRRNLCCSGSFETGDTEPAFSRCPVVVDQTYQVKATQQAMMETFRTVSFLDHAGRLTLICSTQVPFHVRRIAARALDIPMHRIRVVKPRIGGGFGAKQTLVSELFPALVTLKTGKPARMVFSRSECFIGGTSRHAMKIRVRIAADTDGRIRAIHLHTRSNTGAYGDHGPTTVGLSGHKSLPLYHKADTVRFTYEVVYTNTLSAGAYRGYGATQGTFALETAMNELAHRLSMDPVTLRLKNLVKSGDVMPAYYGETLGSCALEACIRQGRERIGWDARYPCIAVGPNRVRSVGMAIAMQGSAIAGVDISGVEIRLQEDGFYTLMIGATDMGTGCDTILAQMAAECLNCDISRIIVHGVDTDVSPYDTGSYASASTYLAGTAVVKACADLKSKILAEGARHPAAGEGPILSAAASHSSPVSPPPFMAGFVEIEVDLETGDIHVLDFVGVVDCGTPVNPALARVQAEGGIVQGLGMALLEDVTYSASGKMQNSSFMSYKIPSRLDIGQIRVSFESSYEPTGPFGAKSIGEVVINTAAPAIAHAVFNATGHWFRSLPITAEAIWEKTRK